MEIIDELPRGVAYSTNEINKMINKKKSQKELLTDHILKLTNMKSLNSFKFKRASLKKRKKSKKRKHSKKSKKHKKSSKKKKNK